MELSVAERYKKALIQKEKNIIKAKDLMYENAQFKDPKYIIEHYENRAQASQENFKHTHTPAEKLLHDSYIQQKKEIARDIRRNTIFSVGINDESTQNIREELEMLLELDSLSEEEFKEKMVENEERNVFNTSAAIKGQLLISELGLKGNKFYLSQYLSGLLDPSIIGNAKTNEIPQIADEISSSKKFKNLMHLHNIGKVSSFINSLSNGATPLGLMTRSLLASSGDYLFSTRHLAEVLFLIGFDVASSKINNKIQSKLHSVPESLTINLEDYIQSNDLSKNNPFTNKNNPTPIEVEFEDVDPNENDNEPNLNEPLEME